MNKQDKKFITALVLAQTGIVLMAITFSSYYWYHSVTDLMKLNNLKEISSWLKGENCKADSEEKVEVLEKHYEKKGIEVLEN